MKSYTHKVQLDKAFWFQEGPGVRNTQFRDSGVKLLNVANITKHGVIDLSKTDRYLDEMEARGKYSHFLVDEGDLVIASSGISIDDDGYLRTRGAFIESKHIPLCMNTSTIRFKSFAGVSDLSYLRHWLQSLDFRVQITRLVTGSAQKNFGPTHLKALSINLPPLNEQKRIAAILDQADELRRKRKHALDRLNHLGQSIFYSMFEEHGERVVSSVRLEEVSEQIDYGLTASAIEGDVGPKFLRITDIQEGIVDWSKVPRCAASEKEIMNNSLELGDIVFARTGATTGKSFLIKDRPEISVFASYLIRVRPSKSIVPEYLFGFFQSNKYWSQIKLMAQGAAQPGVNSSKLKELIIPLPPLNQQWKYKNRIAQIQIHQERYKNYLRRADYIFSALQHRAFLGEL